MSNLIRQCDLKKDDKVLVKIEGGCKGITKRDGLVEDENLLKRDTLQLSNYNTTLRDPNGDGTLTYIWTDLGELANGHYDLKIDVQGQIDNLTIIDSEGEVYAR